MNIKTVGVIGAGTMGNGIVQVCAAAGLKVTMQDIADEAVQRGLNTVSTSLDRLIKKENNNWRQMRISKCAIVTMVISLPDILI